MDPHERQAHDIICMIRYGSPGGSVRNDELRKIADYLRGGPKQRAMPVVPVVPVVPTIEKPIQFPKYPTEVCIPIVFPKVP